MTASIIAIGDEILIGQTIDTNSAFIAKEFNKLGIKIKEIRSISDTAQHIESTVNELINTNNILIVTGGLGPTNDDVTKKVLTAYFEDRLIIYPEILEKIHVFFKKFNKPFLEVNKAQAMLPEKADIIINDIGTASGMLFHKGNCQILSLPGVPYEMKSLLAKYIATLKLSLTPGDFYHKSVQVGGIGESHFADLLKTWEEDKLAKNITVSYLPSVSSLKLRLTGLKSQQYYIDHALDELLTRFPKYILGYEEDTIEVCIAKLLNAKKATVGTVESCTGGGIAKKLVSLPGASTYFKGSFVTYSYLLKEKLVDVLPETLLNKGAVSKEVVIQMAENGRKKLGVDYCISVSGIAGPDGGTDEKPVGTVWIAIATPTQTFTKLFNFGHNRKRNLKSTVLYALYFLRLILIDEIEE